MTISSNISSTPQPEDVSATSTSARYRQDLDVLPDGKGPPLLERRTLPID
jgi:hypothetical protein